MCRACYDRFERRYGVSPLHHRVSPVVRGAPRDDDGRVWDPETTTTARNSEPPRAPSPARSTPADLLPWRFED